MANILIGLTSFNDLKFLRKSLPPLEKLRATLHADFVLLDTAWNEGVRNYVQKKYPEVIYWRHPEGNLGYGRSYNEILRRFPMCEIFLVVTSDVVVDPSKVRTFINRMQKDKNLIMCAGKLHHLDPVDFEKTDRIDSLGIVAEKRHHFYDKGQGERDQGQYDAELGDFFGISGAVFLIQPIRFASGLFDEHFWMYKEDIELAYRVRWLGAKMTIFSEVWAWHARSLGNLEGHAMVGLYRADRKKKRYARIHSYKNHFLLLKKHFTWRYGCGVISRVLGYEFLKGLFMLFCHPFGFFAGIKTLLFVQAQRSPRRVSPKAMLRYFK